MNTPPSANANPPTHTTHRVPNRSSRLGPLRQGCRRPERRRWQVGGMAAEEVEAGVECGWRR